MYQMSTKIGIWQISSSENVVLGIFKDFGKISGFYMGGGIMIWIHCSVAEKHSEYVIGCFVVFLQYEELTTFN